MAWYQEFIEIQAGVQGGYPVVRGTRTPVRSIVEFYRDSQQDYHEVLSEALPHLTPVQIDAAVAYYHEHPETIDEDIERQRAALNEFLARA